MQKIPIRCFTGTAAPSLSSTSAKIKHLVSNGLFEEALRFYKHLHSSGIHGNPSYLPSLLKASSSAQFLPFGFQLHCILLKTGHSVDSVTANSLLSMYSKCSLVNSACRVFDTMPMRDSVAWNSMIMCYTRNGYFSESVETFKEMLYLGLGPHPELIGSVVSACGWMGNLSLGREIHARIVCTGMFEISVLLATALVDMYSRCHDVHTALEVFKRMLERNVVSWTVLIAGCVVNGSYEMSLNAFCAMQVENVKPNRVTLITVLPSCAELGALKCGKEIHGYAFRHGFETEPHVDAALIDMYSKSGASRKASFIFERAARRDVVVWSSIIGSYSRSGDSVLAMNLFHQMRMEGIEPNSITILAVLVACIGLSSVSHGQGIHGYVVKSGLDSDVFVGNSLIDMYSKCGCLNASHQVFEEMPVRDPVSWSAMISSYGLHGFGTDALQLFHEMQEEGIKPDQIMLLAVLSACNHAGLVNEGQKLFDHFIRDQGISLSVEHYACYIDLLGRSGKVEDACEVVSCMPMKASPSIWGCLVSACRVHGKFEVALKLARQLIDSEPENAANYTLLSMIYAESGNWAGVEEVRRVMRERGLKKSSGYSRIQIK
ncbi:pentatricopeptide repeat-containing protein At4g31070, mitochondrial [Magnolia sinica]|uniref:pentatricopeptide repeat-containing protein At4g31070, mitochondrial n=1 Tax=Magnolia sinica TaxID=86752 RepID=UPI002658C69B|nr:pentatricopeptide repeat-containing protein At4g31070, mitochondrial [Magnolia sinica]